MRVLFLTHRLPYAPNRGDRNRAYHVARHLRSFAEVDVVSFVHSPEEASHVVGMADWASSVRAVAVPRLWNWIRACASLTTCTPLTHRLLDAPSMHRVLREVLRVNRPDVVLAFCSGMARFAIEPPLAGLPFLVDMVDVDSEKWRALAERTAAPKRWIYKREATWLSRFETTISLRASTSVVVNERERKALALLAPGAHIEIVPIGVDLSHLTPTEPPLGSMDVVFCGVMNYEPNEQAAVWLAERIWPNVRRRHPQASLRIVGASPTAKVRALANPSLKIEVTGSVTDVRPYLWSSAVSAAPLLTARGVQTKVLEAVGCGLPVVITSAVAAGLPAEVLPACSIADSCESFAAALVECLALPPDARRALAQRADLTALTWGSQLEPYRALLELAIAETDAARS